MFQEPITRLDLLAAGWIMVIGQRIAGAHITSGME